jgi:hypothetical protein
MELSSQKFKYLEQIKALKPELIPHFYPIKSTLPEIYDKETYILRSALQSEANPNNLLSGKSLSLSNLKKKDLKEALEKVLAQDELSEVILQKQILWNQHLTLFYQSDFFFAEIKDRNQNNTFFYVGELGGTNHPLRSLLVNHLKQIKEVLRTEKNWLMEWGYDGEKFYLFQLQPISIDKLTTLLSSEFAFEMVQSKERFSKNQNLWAMLKTEWLAFIYRRKKIKNPTFEAKDVFLNWEFIFHYFRLFCFSKNIKPDEESLMKFYQSLQEDHYLANVTKTHFKLANFWRKTEALPSLNFLSHEKKMRFIGSGQGYFFKNQLVFMEDLVVEDIYQLNDKKIILTKSISLLSHGILAALEQGHSVIFGISDEDWLSLISMDQIYLDFESQKLGLK